jgi:tetratricopeptide (TPR) repeat protein
MRHLKAPAIPVLALALLLLVACAHGQRPFNPRAVDHQAEGARALVRGDLDRAAGLFSLSLDYEPLMAAAHNGLGLVALARGDRDTAESEFRSALALNEELAEAHLNLGFIALGRDQVEDALESFRQALAIDPGYGAARLATGEALLRLGRLEDARWELGKACESQPAWAAAHAAHALVLARLGRIAGAETAVRRALDLDAELPAAHRARAEILRRTGALADAAEELRHVLRVLPGSIDDRLMLATVLAAANDADGALTQLDALEKAAPRRAEVPFVRGFVEMRRGQGAAAATAARRAIALRPKYPEARLLLAEALLHEGRQAEGQRELAIFLEQAPPHLGEERRRAEAFLRGESAF